MLSCTPHFFKVSEYKSAGLIFFLVFNLVSCASVQHKVSNANGTLFIKGVEKYLEGKLDDAYSFLKKEEENEPKNEEVKQFLVKVISEMAVNETINGNYKNARKLLNEALEISPEDKKLKKMYKRLAKLKKEGLPSVKIPAVVVVKPAETKKELSPEEKTILKGEFYNKGVELYQQGKYKEAIKLWENVLKLDPDHKPSIEVIEKARKKIKRK